MPQINIDGKLITAESGKTIIEAAFQNGINIPHFCWHPELSVAGNCRMCLVEVGMQKRLPNGNFEYNEDGTPVIQWFPKLQIACATTIADGMFVRLHNDKVQKAQEAVMEFLLINHPLDCPICDEAGECKLQEYAFKHSNGESRFIEEKNHKPKRIEWGPNVIFDAERCISCSRCIRYAKEIAKQDVLTFVNRGDHVTIELFEGTQFDNDYSMNVIEICPVGALTSKDFRFKTRVWEMSFTESICPGCAKGCNTKIGVRNNEILRIQPNTNMYVNRYWLCDYGRLNTFHKVNQNRITQNQIKIDNQIQKVSFDQAKSFTIENLQKFKPNEVMVIGSPYSTNEDLYALYKFARTILKTKHLDFIPRINESFGDDFLKQNDVTPNSTGARQIGIAPIQEGFDISQLRKAISTNHIRCVIVMNDDLDDQPELLESFEKLDFIISLSSNHCKLTEIANVTFALSTYAEVEGTFTNINGRVQHFTPAVVTKENLHRMGMKMSRLDKFGAHNDHWTQKEIRDCKPGWKIITLIANSMGASWQFKTAKDVFNELAKQVHPFNGMSYELIDKHQGLVLGRANHPDEVLVNYVSHYMKPD